MRSIENDFISKLGAYLDMDFNPFSRARILGFLKEYRSELPPVYINVEKPKLIPDECTKATIDEIINSCCEYFQMNESLLVGNSRKRRIVENRQMLSAYLVGVRKFSLVEVGRRLNRDHTTVLNSKVTVNDLCETNPLFMYKYIQLVNHLNKL